MQRGFSNLVTTNLESSSAPALEVAMALCKGGSRGAAVGELDSRALVSRVENVRPPAYQKPVFTDLRCDPAYRRAASPLQRRKAARLLSAHKSTRDSGSTSPTWP